MRKNASFTIILKLIKNSRFPVSKKAIKAALLDQEIDVSKRSIDRYLQELAQKFLVQRNEDSTYSMNELVDEDEYALFLNFLDVSEISTLAMDTISSRVALKEHILPEYHQNFKGVEWLTSIFKGITHNKQLIFEYATAFGSPKKRKVAPCLVKQYQNRWYLVAVDLEDENTLKTFGLDRISQLYVQGTIKVVVAASEAAAIFKNIVGIDQRPRVAGREGLTNVQIAATSIQAGLFESMPLHSSQKLVDTQGGNKIFSYDLVVNYEFVQHLFMHMPYIEVLEPKWLRSHIREEAQKIFHNHH